ncbi:MAG: YihY/virulence factor BrkB family protein, partial [Thermodesulfobacteriota bacterium]
ASLIKLLRLVYASLREFTEGELTLRAMSLVYTTLLSLVPLLAFSFSVLKAFGVHNQLEPLLFNFLAPLGGQGKEIARKILEFVENMKVGVLGSIGLAMLVYTVVSLIHKIEEALNHIWKIEKSRSFARRFSDYISIILIGPIFVFSAIGLTATVQSNTVVHKLLSIEPLGTGIVFLSKLLPYVFVSSVFTFIYILIPNTKVKFSSALLGGLVAGVLWQTIGWAFASFVVSSTKYTAIYSGFAVVVLFMIWLYLSWLTLLIGAAISFCHQNLKFLTLKKEAFNLSAKLKEKLSVLIMFLIGYNFYHDKDRWTLDKLMNHLGLPPDPIQNTLTQLIDNKLIIETLDDVPSYLPARDIETIKVKEILDSVRNNKEVSNAIENRLSSVREVDAVLERVDDSIETALREQTVKSLVISSDKNG